MRLVGKQIHAPFLAIALSAASILGIGFRQASAAEPVDVENAYDVVIYGGTSAAVTAALQAKRMGCTVVIVSPDKHLGGLTTGGLGWTDSGNKAKIVGLAREFYHRLWMHYRHPDAWQGQTPAEYVALLKSSSIDDATQTMWTFEPHVAETIIDQWIAENDISVVRDARLDRAGGVEQRAGRITSITSLDGETYKGKMFIDATYEGDCWRRRGRPTSSGASRETPTASNGTACKRASFIIAIISDTSTSRSILMSFRAIRRAASCPG